MSSTSFFALPQRGLSAPAVATINHLLAQEAWARDTLMRHAGKTACISIEQMRGHLQVRMRVARDGMLENAAADDTPAVTIHVKLTDLPLILQNRDRAFSYVRIEGDAEFANTISQLSKGLRWDAEHDIERLFGPIAAKRVVGGARSLVEGATTAGRRLLENVAEFLLEERRVLVRPGSVDDFAGDITRLRDDVERTAKRIAKLEQKLAQRPAPATASSSTAIVPAPENALIPMPDNALIELPKTPDNTADS
jgi:ubiquinone biosynthesis protein UbiJ